MVEPPTLEHPVVEDPAAKEELHAWIDDLTAGTQIHDLTRIELRYGEHPEQVGDLWLPAGAGPFPTVALLHGGGFLAEFSREIMTATVADLVRRGYAVWSPEYRRTDLDGGPRPTTDDVAAALAYLQRLDAFVDLDRTVVLGHSAGGYLALWAAGLPGVSRVIALGSVCDLSANALESDDGYARFMGGLPDEVPEAYSYLDLAPRPASLATQVLICGLLDQPHRVRENRAFVAHARAKGELITYEELPDTGHFAFMDPRSLGWERAAAALRVFID